jgi:hypothetical protein
MPGSAISAIIISGLSTLAVLSRALVVLALPIMCSPLVRLQNILQYPQENLMAMGINKLVINALVLVAIDRINNNFIWEWKK